MINFSGGRRESPGRPVDSRIPEWVTFVTSGKNASHTHTDRQPVKAVHQTDGEGQIADFARAKMIEQWQVNIIFSVSFGNVGHRFRPG